MTASHDEVKEMGEGGCLRKNASKQPEFISSGFIDKSRYSLKWLSFGVKILADEIYCLVRQRKSAQS